MPGTHNFWRPSLTGYAKSSPAEHRPAEKSLKIVVAGGFGAGKSTMVGAVSEIAPLSTEETITTASTSTDSLAGVEAKTTTTVAMDFGRITLPLQNVQLLLFGAPGQSRFLYIWDDLSLGALGAVVLADTRRLADSFDVVAFFEKRAIPFVVAVNEFEGAPFQYTPDEVREALELPPAVPVLRCDAREKRSARNVLLSLVEHAADTARATSPALQEVHS
ncbi:ATP/GTP-binding protein [Streptomyces scopuliridis]|uniref:ATP/GTP-binding protein n=1 Tax=Streptomyces scopuliridis TaxID=452529 RepID=A0ACD4ZV71_9ACTN|nr:ATP/GTP-binding protein [Streptomyces scopuliridis]WSC01707.1 ATP/GTP-binding protein [Streptomyces scopuliridis]WSC04754.1 ATP/GTP-binding protein [Streptomyces scopuliridis]